MQRRAHIHTYIQTHTHTRVRVTRTIAIEKEMDRARRQKRARRGDAYVPLFTSIYAKAAKYCAKIDLTSFFVVSHANLFAAQLP